MNAPASFNGLDVIKGLFDSLSEDDQLRLIEYLGERTPYIDEINEGVMNAAIAYGRARCKDDDWAASQLAESVTLIGGERFRFPAVLWARHRACRDRTLRYALRDRSQEIDLAKLTAGHRAFGVGEKRS